MSHNDAFYFDKNARLYDAARPGYPDEIYKIIAENLSKDERGDWLEVGAGNGVASAQIIAKLKPSKLVLLEPGENLCVILREKFGNLENVEITNSTFEGFTEEKKFDVILSATAWHWPERETKYQRAAKLLKPNGKLIIFHNYYDLRNGKMKDEVDKIYEKYNNQPEAEDIATRQRRRISAARVEMKESGLFSIIGEATLESELTYDTEAYLNLLRSFRTNAKFGENFFSEIQDIILQNGGVVIAKILTDLIIARKDYAK